MAVKIRKINYFHTVVVDQPGEAYKLLTTLSELGITLLAFTAVPIGPMRTQLSLFPEDAATLKNMAQSAGIKLDGPHSAILVMGDEKLSAINEIHQKLYQASVNVYTSSGVMNETGCFGYLIYVRPDELEKAVNVLGVE